MTTQTDSITVPARDLDIGDQINGARVTRIDDTTTWGVVYVWVDDATELGVVWTFNHGDRVRITRHPDPAAVRAMFTGFGWTVTNP